MSAKPVRVIAYGALGLAVAVVIVLILSNSGSNEYLIRAQVKDADGMIVGSTVKENGVEVGKVKTLEPTRYGTANIVLEIDRTAAPIGTGASLEVRPTDLLGERYAQLSPGNYQQHPLPSNSLIPLKDTQEPVDLDEILDALDAPTRARLDILINEAGIALQGQGSNFNKLLTDLPPNLSQARQLLGQVTAQDSALKNMISKGADITTVVNNKRDEMGQAIDAAESALGTVASRQAQLASTIQNAPGALTQLRATLAQVGSASQAILPAAVELEHTTVPLTSTLRELPSFAKSAHSTLITAKQVAPSITRLGRGARAPLAALRPTAANIASIASQAKPLTTQLATVGMRQILYFAENFELGTQDRDALGHFIGADLQFDPSIVTSAANAYLEAQGLQPLGSLDKHKAAIARKANVSHAPASTPAAAPTGAAPSSSNPLGKVLSALPKVSLPDVPKTLSGVAGLLHDTTSKVQNLLSNNPGSLIKGIEAAVRRKQAAGVLPPGLTTTAPSTSGSTGSTAAIQHIISSLLGS